MKPGRSHESTLDLSRFLPRERKGEREGETHQETQRVKEKRKRMRKRKRERSEKNDNGEHFFSFFPPTRKERMFVLIQNVFFLSLSLLPSFFSPKRKREKEERMFSMSICIHVTFPSEVSEISLLNIFWKSSFFFLVLSFPSFYLFSLFHNVGKEGRNIPGDLYLFSFRRKKEKIEEERKSFFPSIFNIATCHGMGRKRNKERKKKENERKDRKEKEEEIKEKGEERRRDGWKKWNGIAWMNG